MKRISVGILLVLIAFTLTSCFLFKAKSYEVGGIDFQLKDGILEATSKSVFSGVEITLNGVYEEEDFTFSASLLHILSSKVDSTAIAFTKAGGDIDSGSQLFSLKGDFKSIQELGIEINSFKLQERQPHLSATDPLPDGISVVDTWVDPYASGFFSIHAKVINDLSGSELTITYDPSKITIDKTQANEGVEALNTYASGMLIVQHEENTVKISTAFSGSGKNITDEDIYRIYITTSGKGIADIQLTGEVRDSSTNLLSVNLTGGTIEIGGPILLGDFDDNGEVGLTDFINFARNYGSILGDGRYNELYDIAPAENYYGGNWAGIYDKSTPDGEVALVDFIIFARNYGKTVPENTPPLIPSNPTPTDGATDVSLTPTLSWDCSDPDGDPIVYDVFTAINGEPLTQVLYGITKNSALVDFLQANISYVWKVVAKDGRGGITEGPIWSLDTGEEFRDVLPVGFSASKSVPLEPENGFWVLFDLYTIDEITPSAEYLKASFTFGESEYFFYLPRVSEKQYADAENYKKWIFFPEDVLTSGSKFLFSIFRFLDSEPIAAVDQTQTLRIDLTASYMGVPFYLRDYSEETDNLFTLKRIIREWEDTPAQIPVTWNLSVTTDVEVSVESLDTMRQVSFATSLHGGPIPPLLSGGERAFIGQNSLPSIISVDIERLASPSTQTEQCIDSLQYAFPNLTIEYFTIRPTIKPYTWDEAVGFLHNDSVDYSLNAWVNRFTYFRWSSSEDGINWESDCYDWLNTISSRDFNNEVFPEVMRSSFNVLSLRYFDLDEDGQPDFYAELDSDTQSVYFLNRAQEMFLVETAYSEIADFALEALSGQPVDFGQSLGGLNHGKTLIVKTTAGKYAKIEILGVTRMTLDQILDAKNGENLAPCEPISIKPLEGSDDIDLQVELEWFSFDLEGESITYDLYVGEEGSLEVQAEGLATRVYMLSNLQPGTTYNWKIIARDNLGGITEGPTWSFTVIDNEPDNYLPDGFSVSEVEPSDPVDGYWVLFDIFSIDEITPSVDRVKVTFEFCGSCYYFWLQRTDQKAFTDSCEYCSWLYFPEGIEEVDPDITFSFSRPEGITEIQAIEKTHSWYIRTSRLPTLTSHYDLQDYSPETDRLFTIKRIIREWEDTSYRRLTTWILNVTTDASLSVNLNTGYGIARLFGDLQTWNCGWVSEVSLGALDITGSVYVDSFVVFRDRLYYLHSRYIALRSFRARKPSTVLRHPTRPFFVLQLFQRQGALAGAP